MDEIQSEVANLITELLTFCCSDKHRTEINLAAVQQEITFEQLVAAAITQKMSEDFVITSRHIPLSLITRRQYMRKSTRSSKKG